MSPRPQSDPPARTPCYGCEYRPDCAAYDALNELIYSKPGFTTPEMTAKFLSPDKAAQLLDLLARCVARWLNTVDSSDLPDHLNAVSLPALFDVLMSGLYAAVLYDDEADLMSREAFVHENSETWAYFPYIWMCPGCVAAGAAPKDAYLPGGILRRDRRMYAVKELLARPEGRMIGDFGALCIRAIVSAIVREDAHFAAGGGHRGEFDLIVSTPSQLVLGETKASPLVAFPLAVRLPPGGGEHHAWLNPRAQAQEWAFFVGAAPSGERYLTISEPRGSAWPLGDVLGLVSNASTVQTILNAWYRHFIGYRKFNEEDPATRWHRFGCGNIETQEKAPGKATQLRVDNTKILPGIDRTDDIKKGIAQIMLFGRLKRGCRKRAIKTVLFGNLYAETHHEHYVKPLASLELLWPGHDPVWLFDGILALSRNILNDSALEALFGLPNQPYESDEIDAADLVEGVEQFGEPN